MLRLIFVLISFTFYAKQFYELSQGYAFLFVVSFLGLWSSKVFTQLYNLISDVEIDICAHMFHVLHKTVLRTESRICIPFCCLISRILKLKGIHSTDDDSPCTKSSPINMRTFNASIGYSLKKVKMETSASYSGLRFSSISFDEKLDNIVTSIEHQDIWTHIYLTSS